jgi:Arc/MetJ-type ribon-helix-helix transcriptional regulator
LAGKERNSEEKPELRNITINLPDQYDEVIQKLIHLKLIPSRSEAIRTALREFLQDEFQNLDMMENFLNEPFVEKKLGLE